MSARLSLDDFHECAQQALDELIDEADVTETLTLRQWNERLSNRVKHVGDADFDTGTVDTDEFIAELEDEQ